MHFRSILTRCYSFSYGSRYSGHQAKCQTQFSRKEASKVEVKLNLVFCQKREESCHPCSFRTDLYAAKKRTEAKMVAACKAWDVRQPRKLSIAIHWRGNVWKGLEQPGLFPNLPVQCPDQWFHPCWWLRCLWWLREMKGIVCRYDGKVRLAGERYCGWQGGHLGNAMCFPGTREWRREICNTRPPCNTAIL